jgi:hypothetical protein
MSVDQHLAPPWTYGEHSLFKTNGIDQPRKKPSEAKCSQLEERDFVLVDPFFKATELKVHKA